MIRRALFIIIIIIIIIRFNDICFVYNILKNNNASFSGEKVANRAEQSSRRILLVVGAFWNLWFTTSHNSEQLKIVFVSVELFVWHDK